MHPEDQNISEIEKKDYDLADSLFKMLGKGPSREEFKAIGEIIYGLLDEGPIALECKRLLMNSSIDDN